MIIITCPSCSTRFKMDSSLIPDKGRIVRCSACHYKWRLMPTENDLSLPNIIKQDKTNSLYYSENSAPPAQSVSDTTNIKQESSVQKQSQNFISPPPIPPEQVKKAQPKKSDYGFSYKNFDDIKSKKLVITILSLLVFLISVIILFFTFRKKITEYIPQTEKIYGIFGLEINKAGIALVKPFLEQTDAKTLSVQGTILNTHTKDTLPIPPIKISLIDASNFPIKDFVFSNFKNKDLRPGGEEEFIYKIDIPKGAVDVRIEFLTDK